ncbi:MAG: response regulator [Candidatus Spechtbacterales bacterium]
MEELPTPVQGQGGEEQHTTVKVVVIEDDQFLRDMVVEKLTKEGFATQGAVDGEQGIELVQRVKPQIILLDIILPGMDGFEVLGHLQANAETKTIPIIVISNLGSDEDIQKARALGANDYLIKAHFTPAEIVAKVREVMQRNYL